MSFTLDINNNILSEQSFTQAGSIQANKDEWYSQIVAFGQTWFNQNPSIDIQTSGSTGPPKIIEVQKADLIKSAQTTARYFGLKKDQTALLCLPIDFIGGKMMFVRAVVLGLHIKAIAPSANPFKSMANGVDLLAITPYQLNKLLADETTLQKLNNCQTVLVGGGPINPKDLAAIKSLKCKIYATYGMTETLSHIAVSHINENSSSPLTFEIIDPQFEIDQTEESCLQIRTPYKHAQQVKTKDVCNLLNQHSFQILGRLDHVVNSGGLKLFPEKIESTLAAYIEHPFFIGSINHDGLGQELVLFVESKKKDTAYTKMLQQLFINQIPNKYERPRQVVYLNHFIYTDSNKLNRKETLLQNKA